MEVLANTTMESYCNIQTHQINVAQLKLSVICQLYLTFKKQETVFA